MTHVLRRATNIFFTFLLAVMSVNLSGVLTLQNAFAAPGNNGTLKVHELGTPLQKTNEDPKVCQFNFEGFKFDEGQTGYIVVSSELASDGVNSLASPIPFGPTANVGKNQIDAYAQTDYVNTVGSPYQLPNGHYKATLYGKDGNDSIDLTNVKAKSKVFKITCKVTPNEPTQIDNCGTVTDGYAIPTTAGVKYQVRFNNSGNWTDISAGTYPYNGGGTVNIRALSTDEDVKLNSPNTWNFTYTNTTCPVAAKPVVTVVPATCSDKNDATGTATATITNSTDGTHAAVTYDWKVTQGATVIASGTTGSIADGASTTVNLTGLAPGAYTMTITGSDKTTADTTFTIAACDVPVKPKKPKMHDECGTDNDTYKIPNKEGVDYYVNNDIVPATAGKHPTNGASSVTITAKAQPGYVLTGKTTWTLTFDTNACPIKVTPPAPIPTEKCGTDQDGYTIPADHDGVIYKVNGKTVEGFNPATGTVTITAEADQGYVLDGQTSSWTFTFDDKSCAPEPCEPSVVTELTLSQLVETDDDCKPGMGGGGTPPTTPETPSTPPIAVTTAPVTELPQTGPDAGDAVSKFMTLLIAGITTYGATYFIVNRRDLVKK